jgi:hypothetical protein
MRRPTPIFHSSAASPPLASEPGLIIAKPLGRVGPVAWLHARVTRPAADVREQGSAWLLDLHVTAVTTVDQVAQIAALCRVPAWMTPPRWHLHGELASLALSFDLGAVFRYPLHAEPLFVHLSCAELCSQIVVLGTEQLVVLDTKQLAAPELSNASTPIEPDRSARVSRLIDAYTLARLDRHADALELFETVLTIDHDLRADVDACHLYNAACMLDRVGVHKGALSWLREDARRRVKARVAASLASHAEAHPPSESELDAALREHFDHAATDPDLEGLGEQRQLAALLKPHR